MEFKTKTIDWKECFYIRYNEWDKINQTPIYTIIDNEIVRLIDIKQ